MKTKPLLATAVTGLFLGAICAGFSPTLGQAYSPSAELQAKIDSHPHVRKLTDWGSRPEWSADSKKLLFLSKEFGDVFELDLASGRSRPITFHFSHDGIFRAYYLPNGDFLLTAAREHTPGKDMIGRFYDSEMWLLKGDLSGPPIAFKESNMEGAAVARGSMKVAWVSAAGGGALSRAEIDKRVADPGGMAGDLASRIWLADIVVDGALTLANKRLLMDCRAPAGALAQLLARTDQRCVMLEPQNFAPLDDQRFTFSMLAMKREGGPIEVGAYVLDLKTNAITKLTKTPSYVEVEGVFPDGKSTLVEYSSETEMTKATPVLDLWRVPLDGSGRLKRITRYNAIDPELKSNQGVVSPDGRWMAFSVSTRAIEEKVPGQGIGLFLLDLKAAGVQ